MGREAKRVPVGFDWPLKKVWDGYLMPERLEEKECPDCGGLGTSPEGRRLKDLWYGPSQWQHHLDQDDVDALLAAERLRDFTHKGGEKIDPPPTVTAAQVNAWACNGRGHDSINQHVVADARCAREGLPYRCATCGGEGTTERWPGQRAEAEAWQDVEPPTGDGWQMWETTSEGSPISPVFETAEELAAWCADNASVFGRIKAPYDQWLKIITGEAFAHVQIAPGVVAM